MGCWPRTSFPSDCDPPALWVGSGFSIASPKRNIGQKHAARMLQACGLGSSNSSPPGQTFGGWAVGLAPAPRVVAMHLHPRPGKHSIRLKYPIRLCLIYNSSLLDIHGCWSIRSCLISMLLVPA